MPVLPPFDGGLHCGLRSFDAVSGRRQPVLPPFNGGLHCGSSSAGPGVDAVRCAPAVRGGLHCGLIDLPVDVCDEGPARCSRRQTAGSIAASNYTADRVKASATTVLPPVNWRVQSRLLVLACSRKNICLHVPAGRKAGSIAAGSPLQSGSADASRWRYVRLRKASMDACATARQTSSGLAGRGPGTSEPAWHAGRAWIAVACGRS